MTKYADLVAEDRRLVILRLLAESAKYSANEYLLQQGLHAFGHEVGHDLLRTELAWLAEQGLLDLDEVAGVRVAKLRERGVDVASGVAIVPGVKRPRPGE